MDFQQPNGFMRPPPTPPPPPPPPPSDPYYHHQQRPLQNPSWYSAQFPFQHGSSPPQPPPQHHQWPPQHADQYLPPHHSYPSHPTPPSYPAPPNQYPHPPPPHSHPSLPPRPPQMPPQSYPQVNQEWGPASWGHQQSWDHQAANNNEEAWAAKARAWAASKVASDDQQSQHTAYAFNDGSNVADFTSAYAGHDASIIPSVHQQEVPSTYNSAAGNPMRGLEHAAASPADYNFVPPAEPAVAYPPVPAMFPAGSQVDYSVTAPSVPGHPAPIYGRLPGFQPTVSSVATPFGMGLGPELHPRTTFPGDSFGVPVTAERPKKASVPNWLREEIIKNKPVFINSAAELPKDDAESTDDDFGKGDQKSFDSRSTEEEEEEEDLEAAKTAAINHEIKRIVTDVLLQVTAELFDEIATKVLSEDDPTVEDSEVAASTANFPDTDSTVSVPQKNKDTVSTDVSIKFDSSPGDLLGLASYASDDDDDCENSDTPAFKEKNSEQSIANNLSTGKDVVDDGGLEEKERNVPVNLEADLSSSRKDAPIINNSVTVAEKDKEVANASIAEQRLPHHTSNSKTPGSKDDKKTEIHISRKCSHDFVYEPDKNDRNEYGPNYSGKNHIVKELDVPEEKSVYKRKEETQTRHDERRNKKERRYDRHSSKEGGRDSTSRPRDSDTRKRLSPDYIREGRRDRQTDSRADATEENGGKRARTKDVKREKYRDRDSMNSSRHDKRHTSSVSYRDREQRDGTHAGDSSDESSDDSKKKLHFRRKKSPSPVRSRKRHVSRSPHSKHSQRKHSPYYSLENSRGKMSRSRSRSRSPVRRKR